MVCIYRTGRGAFILITIHHAILHILDFTSGLTVFSDQDLELEDSTLTFLLKHIEKSLNDQSAKNGTFYEDSACKQKLAAYVSTELSFADFSRYVAETIYAAVAHAEEMDSADILVIDAEIEESRQLIIFKCNNHKGFIHQVVQTPEGIKNDIVNHCAIMPNISQRISEFAFIDLSSQAIKFTGPLYSIDGNKVCIMSEILLECAHTASPKELLKTVGQVARKVAAEYGQDDVQAVTAVKSFIAENIQSSDQIDPLAIGREVFKEHPGMQADYDKQLQSAGLTDPVQIDQEFTLKKMKNHKLKTDTGIELTIPLDYFNNTDYIEFVNNEDGTISITLKHIMNLTNRA